MRHALIDVSGNIVNVVMLEGGANWTPPDGLTAIRDKIGEAEPGGMFSDSSFYPKPAAVPIIHEKTMDEKLAELEDMMSQKTTALEAKIAAMEAKAAKFEKDKSEN
jgi:hypothetical protein